MLHNSLHHAEAIQDAWGTGGGGGLCVHPHSKWLKSDVGNLVTALAVEAGNRRVQVIQAPSSITVELAVNTLHLALI